MKDIAKEEKFVKTAKYIWGGIVISILLIIILGYNLGYRLKDNLTVGKIGELTMSIPMPLTHIYIDSSKKIETKKDNEEVNIKLSPKSHSIIVARDGYFPWTKTFTIPSGSKIKLEPMFVSQNASGQIITQKDPEYWKIRGDVYRNILPTEKYPISSKDKTATLWVNNNTIYIKVASSTIKVIQTETPIRNVAFYKERVSAVIFSTSDSVFVIETDTKSEQNFMPIYRGTKPIFISNDPNFIYVLDGENLMQVII